MKEEQKYTRRYSGKNIFKKIPYYSIFPFGQFVWGLYRETKLMLFFSRVLFFLVLSLFLFNGVSAQEANFSFDEDTGLKEKRKHLQTIDGVAAIVGERVVLNSDINQSLAMAIFQQKLDPNKDASKIALLRNEILRTTVDRKVVLLMAELDSVVVDDKEVDRALTQQVDNIVSQAGSDEAAEKALGQPLRTFKREYWYEIKDMLTTQKYQQALMQKVSVSKKDVIGFFQTYKDSIPSFPSTVKLKHLLIKVVPDSSQEQKTISFLNDLRERILNKSSSFEVLAADYSQDPGSKNSGGSLGFVRRGSLVTPFESVAFNLSPGEISKPIKTDFGYHIIETQEIRGDRIKVRHILMSPPTTEKDESIAYQKAIAIKDSSFSLELNLSSEKLGCKYITQLTGIISILFFIIAFFLFTISLTKRSLLL